MLDATPATTDRRTRLRTADMGRAYTAGSSLYVASTPTWPSTTAKALLGAWSNVETALATGLGFGADSSRVVVWRISTGSIASAPIGWTEERVPSEQAFEYLAHHKPSDLLDWIRSGELPNAALTFAAEAAGRVTNSVAVIAVLVPLLEHQSPLVREGAVYGLQRHARAAEARTALERVVAQDPSRGVREAAEEALDSMEE